MSAFDPKQTFVNRFNVRGTLRDPLHARWPRQPTANSRYLTHFVTSWRLALYQGASKPFDLNRANEVDDEIKFAKAFAASF